MFKKLRIWYWIASAFIRKYALGLTIGSICGIVLALYGDRLIRLIPTRQTYHIARVGPYTLSQIPLDIQQLVSKGITKVNSSGSWELDAAESITPSEDGIMYTVKLKPDLRWSNSQLLTSADFDMANTDVVVEKPDSQTLVFKLKDPFAPFPSILSQPLLKKIRVGTLRKKTQIIGLNEYGLQNVQVTNQRLKTITLKSPMATRIYHFYPTEEDALIAFKLGKVDQLESMTAPYLDDWPMVTISKQPDTNRYLALFFNMSNQQLQDKSVRQLLAYATPKKTDESRILSPIRRTSWAYNPQVKPYLYNAETAKSMLDKLKKANPQLKLELVLTTTPAYADMAQLITDAWQKLGLNAQLKIVPYPDTSDYQVLLIGQQVPDDPDQYPLWHSSQPENIAHYESPKIDKLLEDGRKEINKEKRKEIYQDFQRFLIEDCPVVFLHQLPMYDIKRNSLLSQSGSEGGD